jgi:hypothetical protein
MEDLYDAGTFGIYLSTPLDGAQLIVPVGRFLRRENMADKNNECKCPYGCARHGNCKACQEYHRKDGSRTNCGKTGNEGKK